MVEECRAQRSPGRAFCRASQRSGDFLENALAGLVPGTELIVKRRLYWHHGIYVGNGRVIHYAGWFHSAGGQIEEVSLAHFTHGRPCRVGQRPADGVRAEEIARRARSRMGERSYDLLRNNCEHFCNWCHFGRAHSRQVAALSKPEFVFCSLLQSLRSRCGEGAPIHAGQMTMA